MKKSHRVAHENQRRGGFCYYHYTTFIAAVKIPFSKRNTSTHYFRHLPWYMDWYEQDTIDDLESNQPNIVVYNEEQATWGYTYYANAFVSALKENYTRLSDNPDDGWKYRIWTRDN